MLEDLAAPIISNPVTREWGGALALSEETGGAFTRGLGIFPPGNDGPAEHFHPGYEERFEVLEGEFVFVVDGERTTRTVGETLAVPPKTPHTFRNESADVATIVMEARPAAAIEDVLATLFGLAHDGKLLGDGRPRFLQAMATSPLLAGDTAFTSPPPLLQKALATAFAPLARLAGYRATYPQYLDESFWVERVEQPN